MAPVSRYIKSSFFANNLAVVLLPEPAGPSIAIIIILYTPLQKAT